LEKQKRVLVLLLAYLELFYHREVPESTILVLMILLPRLQDLIKQRNPTLIAGQLISWNISFGIK